MTVLHTRCSLLSDLHDRHDCSLTGVKQVLGAEATAQVLQAGVGGQESLAVMVSKEVAGLGEDPTVLPPASVQQSCHLPMTPSLLKSFFLNSMDLRGHREGKNGVPAVLQKCLFCNCTLCGFAYLVKTVLMAPYLQGKRLER